MMSILNMILLKLVFCYTKKKEENHVYNWPKQTKDKNIKFDPLGLFFLHQKSHVNYKYVQLYFPTECQGSMIKNTFMCLMVYYLLNNI